MSTAAPTTSLATAGTRSAERAPPDRPGHDAYHPLEYPPLAWWAIAKRVFNHMLQDQAGLAAAGVTFYLILSLFPAIAAFVSIFGLVADPDVIRENLESVTLFLPTAGIELIESELNRIISSGSEALGIAFFSGLIFSLWSANNSVRSLFQAMNVIYGEIEQRSFVKSIALTFAFTLCGMFFGLFVLNAIVVLSVTASYLGIENITNQALALVPPLALFALFTVAIACLYRWGPSRRPPKWRWVMGGAAVAAAAWLIVSVGFAFFLANFANYNATYGSLGAAIALMMWFFLSSYIVIFGAALNAEMERQTDRDTTAGPERPKGARGARVADTSPSS